jgi:hypothetical protein
MPALNIDFSEEELARLREQARRQGVSMRTMAHDTIVNSNRQEAEDAAVWAAYQQGKALSAELLALLADQ